MAAPEGQDAMGSAMRRLMAISRARSQQIVAQNIARSSSYSGHLTLNAMYCPHTETKLFRHLDDALP